MKKVKGLLPACVVGNSLNINVVCSSTKRSVWRNVKFGEEEKRRFCLNHAKPLKSPHSSLWTSQSCFLSSNWFFECAHPFIMNRWSKTEHAVPSRRLVGSADRVGSLLVCTWCHRGYVDGQERNYFSPLGTKHLFSCKLYVKKFYSIDPQHGRLVTWLQPLTFQAKTRWSLELFRTNYTTAIKWKQDEFHYRSYLFKICSWRRNHTAEFFL